VNPPVDQAKDGFTLIEVLVAVLIASILLTVVYGSLSRTLSSKGTAEERAEMYAQAREAVLRMAGELEAAAEPGVGDGVVFIGDDSGGDPPRDSVQFVTVNRGRYGSEQVRAGRVLVTYGLEELPDRHGLFALARQEFLLSCLLADARGIEGTCDDLEDYQKEMATVLLDCADAGAVALPGDCQRVVGLDLQYFDDAENQWRDDWNSTDDSSTLMHNRLPAAVRIALFLEDEREVVHDFSTVVDLPLARGQPTPRAGRTTGNGEENHESE